MKDQDIKQEIQSHLQDLEARIKAATEIAGRDRQAIRVIGVCKHQPAVKVKAILELGLKDLGQNYVQELGHQKEDLGACFSKAAWHFVGKLQSNKVKPLLNLFGPNPPMVHTLDRANLAKAINTCAVDMGLKAPVPCLIQVLPKSLDHQGQRGGCVEEEIIPLLRYVRELPAIAIRGFMILPEPQDDPRMAFDSLTRLGRSLSSEISRLSCERLSLEEYSMGMTGDLEHAILAGATMIRIGTGLFGAGARNANITEDRDLALRKTHSPGTRKAKAKSSNLSVLGFIGAGNIAEALIRGLLKVKALPAANIYVSNRSEEKLAILKKKYKIKATKGNSELVLHTKVIFLCVKPQDLGGVAAEIKGKLRREHVLVSLAAGIPLRRLREMFGTTAKIVRSMPNTPALVGMGVTGLFPSPEVTAEDLAGVRKIFGAVGIVAIMKNEALMDLITGLSGSGPAFVLYFIEAMMETAIAQGLSRKEALSLSTQTVLGTSQLLKESADEPLLLRRKVTSPGGTTIEGIKALEEGFFTQTVQNAIKAAQNRSRNLAQSY